MNILLIDDDEMILAAISFKLKEKGYIVHIAANGSKAVDVIVDNTFDLIICDLMMPIISGATFLSMRESFFAGNVPVIVMSSLGEGDEMLKKLNINFEFFLKKPIQFEKLFEIIDQIKIKTIQKIGIE
ncbi:MAG: response regulator [Bacteroidota bacterium]